MGFNLLSIIGRSPKNTSQAVTDIKIDPRILTAKKIKEEISSFFHENTDKKGQPVTIIAGDRIYDIYATDPNSGEPSDIKWKTVLQRNGQPLEQTHKLVLYDGRLPEYSIVNSIPVDSRNKAWSKLTKVGIPDNSAVSKEPDLSMLTIIVSDLQNMKQDQLQQKTTT